MPSKLFQSRLKHWKKTSFSTKTDITLTWESQSTEGVGYNIGFCVHYLLAKFKTKPLNFVMIDGSDVPLDITQYLTGDIFVTNYFVLHKKLKLFIEKKIFFSFSASIDHIINSILTRSHLWTFRYTIFNTCFQ